MGGSGGFGFDRWIEGGVEGAVAREEAGKVSG